MARKHPNPSDHPPSVSSSGEEEEEVEEVEEEEVEDAPNATHDGSESESDDEEEEEEDEEEDDDEDEDEKTEKSHAQPSQSKPVSKNPKSAEEEDEDEDDDETESDSDPRSPGLSAFTIKKHVDSPKSVSQKPKKSKSSSSSIVDKESLSPVLVSLKRPAEADLPKDSKSTAKKSKAVNGGGVEGAGTEKKFVINRVWDEPSEIAILKGMIDYQERGLDPNSDSAAFHEFLKDRLSLDVTTTQLMDKIKRLKRKYTTNVGKGQNGEDPVFSKPHEHKSFELSKKVWGSNLPNKRSSKKKPAPTENSKPNPKTETPKPKTKTVKPKTEVVKDNGTVEPAMSVPEDQIMVDVGVRKEQGKGQEGSFSQLYPFLELSLKRNNSSFADLVSRDGAEAMTSCLRCLESSTLEELEEEWRKQILHEAEVCAKRSVLLQKQVQLISNWNAKRG